MLLSAVSVLVVAQSSSEIPEGLMNNPVFTGLRIQTSMSLYDPNGSPPAEAHDVSSPQGTLVRDTSYSSAGEYPFRSYSDTDVCIHNPVNTG